MQRKSVIVAVVCCASTFLLLSAGKRPASGHCQVPCGIYDDEARITSMLEDVTTIAKAVDQINSLTAKHSPLDVNQAVRWINTKEEHASRIIETVSVYFLTQKVKEVAAGEEGYETYLKQLADHHAVLRAAMKTKQTVDPEAVAALKTAVEKLATHYHAH